MGPSCISNHYRGQPLTSLQPSVFQVDRADGYQLPALRSLLNTDFPPANRQLSTSLSTPEWRFFQLAVLMGQFSGQSEAIRYYVRRGMEADGVLKEAITCL